MYIARGVFLVVLLGACMVGDSWARRGEGGLPDDRGGDGRKRDRDGRRRKDDHTEEGGEPSMDDSDLTDLDIPNTDTWGRNISHPLSLPSQVGSLPGLQPKHPKPADVQYGCKELRSKRYISDGFCTSIKPITEVVCTGVCLPIRNLPWYAEFVKVWARTKTLEYRCEDARIKRKKVHLSCENGETRTYKIKVVKSCKCKRYVQYENTSNSRYRNRRRRKNKYHKKKNNTSRTHNGDTEL